LELEHLATICRNVLDDNEFLNPSIGTRRSLSSFNACLSLTARVFTDDRVAQTGTWLNDEAGKVAKELFLNKALFSDVTFEVEGDASLPLLIQYSNHARVLICEWWVQASTSARTRPS
jgi:hypothetical protein